MFPLYKLCYPNGQIVTGYYYSYKTLFTEYLYAYKDKISAEVKIKYPDITAVDISRYHSFGCTNIDDFIEQLNAIKFIKPGNNTWNIAERISKTDAILFRVTAFDHYVLVDNNTGVERLLHDNPLLDVCTYYRDKRDSLIFDRDIVKSDSDDISRTYGIVYLDKETLQYKVRFIREGFTPTFSRSNIQDSEDNIVEGGLDDSENNSENDSEYDSEYDSENELEDYEEQMTDPTAIVALTDMQWEIIGHYSEEHDFPEEIKKVFPCEIYLNYGVFLRDYGCKFNWQVPQYGVFQTNTDVSYICKVKDHGTKYGFPFAIYSPTGNPTLYLSTLQCVLDLKASTTKHALMAFIRGVLPDKILVRNSDKVHRPIIVQDDIPIFEDDEMHLRDEHDMKGHIRYIPEQARYMIEILSGHTKKKKKTLIKISNISEWEFCNKEMNDSSWITIKDN